jgi:hypothetical protein
MLQIISIDKEILASQTLCLPRDQGNENAPRDQYLPETGVKAIICYQGKFSFGLCYPPDHFDHRRLAAGTIAIRYPGTRHWSGMETGATQC